MNEEEMAHMKRANEFLPLSLFLTAAHYIIIACPPSLIQRHGRANADLDLHLGLLHVLLRPRRLHPTLLPAKGNIVCGQEGPSRDRTPRR